MFKPNADNFPTQQLPIYCSPKYLCFSLLMPVLHTGKVRGYGNNFLLQVVVVVEMVTYSILNELFLNIFVDVAFGLYYWGDILRFSWDLPDICLIYVWGANEISQRYTWDLPLVCLLVYLQTSILAYSKDICEIYMRYVGMDKFVKNSSLWLWQGLRCMHILKCQECGLNTSLAAPWALAHHLQNPKWELGGLKMADGVWKGVSS